MSVIGIDGSGRRQIGDVPIRTLALSPDGRTIAFTDDEQFPHVNTMGIDGANVRQITDLTCWCPAFSPDSRRIAFGAFKTGDQAGHGLRIIDADGTNERRIGSTGLGGKGIAWGCAY